ncbi:MAG: YdcF family protein [Alphaproteobacteria bacterium]
MRHRLRWLLGLGLGVVLAGAAWAAGLFWFVALIPSEPMDDARTTDAVVVLTGGRGRLEAGLEQLGQDRAKKLFVSGVYRGVEVAKLLDLSTQAPERVECCIVLGHSADNTTGNARETAEWMSKEGYTSLRLVTAAYHMPRSLLEFRHAMPTVMIVPHPVFPESVKHSEWWRWPGTASLIISEYVKYLLVLARNIATEPPSPFAPDSPDSLR